MKKTILRSVTAITAILAVSSCNKEISTDIPQEGSEVSFIVSQAQTEDATKLSMDGLKIKWEAGDKIYVNSSDHRNGTSSDPKAAGYYYSRAPKEFVAQGSGTAVEFKGNDMATVEDATHFAIYPYSKALNIKADNAKNYIPFFPYQLAVAGDFPKYLYYPEESSDVSSGIQINGQKMAVLYGREQTRKEGEKIGKIEMKCMNAFLRFRFASNDIKELHITSKNGNYIAAEKVMFKADKTPIGETDPTYLVQQAGYCGAYSLVLIPEKGTFEAGKDYYAAILPISNGNGELCNGKLTVVMYKTNGTFSQKESKEISVVANKIYNLGGTGNLDELEGLSWNTAPTEDKVIALDFANGLSGLNLYTDSSCKNQVLTEQNLVATASGSKSQSFYVLDGSNKLKMELVANKGATCSIKLGTSSASVNATSATCVFQIPYLIGYTCKKVEVELNSYTGDGRAYLSANKDNMNRVTASGDDKFSTIAGFNNKVELVTKNTAPASRDFLIFDKGATYEIKKISFIFAPGSWPGSWE